ncbi:MAG: hypothetical protein IJM19_08050 [Ruminococcus sp.]|nr:hypothetical protein [Ruminococcus sp.]
MNCKKIISAIIAVSAFAGAVPINSLADETVIHTVTVLDFDGNVMEKIQVEDGKDADLSSVDTSSLESHPDVYTQQGFNCWSRSAENITEDIDIQALWKKMTISLDGVPARTEYFAKSGKVVLDGLKVSITADRQTPELDENGNFSVEREELDITSSCKASVTELSEAFASGTSAEVSIYPIGSSKPIFTYDINYFSSLGDANADGYIDSVDASYVLSVYAKLSAMQDVPMTETKKKCCDVTRDGILDSNDASLILNFYAVSATSQNPNWESFLYKNV